MKYQGTLEYIEKAKKPKMDWRRELQLTLDGTELTDPEVKHGFWRVSGPLPAMMIARIVPNSWSNETGVVEVRDNPANVEHIDWIMARYRLEVKNPELWSKRKCDLEERKALRENIAELQAVEVSSAFTGKLMEFQKQCIDFLRKLKGCALIADEMGLGKCEFIENNVFTPSGRKKFKDLVIGDRVIGSDGQPKQVIGVFPQGKKKLYRVTFNDGCSILVGGEHLWTVSSRNEHRRIVLSTEQMLDKNGKITLNGVGWNAKKPYSLNTYFKEPNGNNRWQIPIISRPMQFLRNETLPIDPYFLGVLLGDGSLANRDVRIDVHKDDFAELVGAVKHVEHKPSGTKRRASFSTLKPDLAALGLMGTYSHTKFIPEIYKYASANDRLSILQGLMDTDGHCNFQAEHNGFQGTEYSTVSERLAHDVIEIVHSLGGVARLGTKNPMYTYKGKRLNGQKSYRINIKLPEGMNPFKLKRKASKYKYPIKYHLARYIIDIQYEREDEALCIAVDSPDRLYVTENGIVTHNTVESLAYIADEGNKSFPVIVVCEHVAKINWKREITKFLQIERDSFLRPGEKSMFNPKVVIIEDGKEGRLPPAEFYVINYDLLHKRKDDIIAVGPRTLILDEGHNIRHNGTQKYKATKEIINCGTLEKILALTGTPIYNHGQEIYWLVDTIRPGLLGTHEEFMDIWCDPDDHRKIAEDKRDALAQLLREYVMIRRTKDEVLKDLPEKVRHKQRIDIDIDFYESEMAKNMQDLKQKLAEAGTDLRSISQAYSGFANRERQIAGIAKIPYIAEFVENMLDLGEPLVVFMHHHKVIDLLVERLAKYNPVFVTGRQTPRQKQDAIDAFMRGDTNLIICGLRSGKTSINLTRGHYVVFGEFDWSPGTHSQAEDRLHRIGQKNIVFAYYLHGAFTFDEKMVENLVEKKVEINSIMGEAQKEEQKEINMEGKAKEIIAMLNERLSSSGRGVDITMPDKARIRLERKEAEALAKLAEDREEAGGDDEEDYEDDVCPECEGEGCPECNPELKQEIQQEEMIKGLKEIDAGLSGPMQS